MTRDDPYLNFNFRVEIEGVAMTGFCHVEALESLVRVVDRPRQKLHKAPGRKTVANVVIKRALTDSRDLWEWHERILDGREDRRNASIVVMNERREDGLRIGLRDAWPCRWKLGPLDALRPDVLIEEVELAFESLRLES